MKPNYIFCLATLQPIAWALFNGKTSDNRHYTIDYRGNLLIYATKPNNYQLRLITKDLAAAQITPPELATLPQAAIIGSVDLIGIVQMDAPNSYYWHFDHPQIWENPIPLTNKNLFFRLPLDFLRSQGHDLGRNIIN